VITAIWTTWFVESWRKREQTLFFEWDLGILRERYDGAERPDFHFMSMYDSNTNIRTKTGTRNRSLAKAKQVLFGIFMFGVVGASLSLVDPVEAEDGPLSAEAVAASALQDLTVESWKGAVIAILSIVYGKIYASVSDVLIDDMNFKY